MEREMKFKGYWIICIESYIHDGLEILKGKMDYHTSTYPIISTKWRKATEKEVLEKQHGKNGFYNISTFNTKDLTLFVHNDIEEAVKFYNIPMAFYTDEDVYILQEDRCVFVGSIEVAKRWIKQNEGKYLQSRFPIDYSKSTKNQNY